LAFAREINLAAAPKGSSIFIKEARLLARFFFAD